MGNRQDMPRVAAIAVVMAALIGSAGIARADGASCKLRAVEMPVEIVDHRAIATLSIDGTPVRLAVDTGAFFSMLTDATAQQLALPLRTTGRMTVRGLTGDVEAHMTTVKHLKLLKSEFPNIDFLVGGNEAGGGAMGLLGRNVLNIADIEYDLAHGVIRFVYPQGDCRGENLAYWADESAVSELHLMGSGSTPLEMRAPAQLNGEEVEVLMDTGARSAVALRAARRVGITEAQLQPDGFLYGAGAQSRIPAFTAMFDSFSIGGETIRHNRIEVADFKGEEMLLGIDFFLSHRLYVSHDQRRVLFTYNGGTVFAHNQVDAAAAGTSAAGATEREPADAAAFARRGAASAARNDFPAALADLDRAVALAPEVGAFHRQRALLRWAGRDTAGATHDLDDALRLDPADTDARAHRAHLRIETGDRDGALADLQALDQALAPQANVRLAVGQLYETLGLAGRALPEWSQWLDAHPSDIGRPQVLDARCRSRLELDIALTAAAADCEAALAAQPKSPRFLETQGWLHLRRGELAQARRDYDRALALDADAPWSLYGRGIVRLRTGEEAAGRADIAAARQRLPSIDAEAHRYGWDAGVPPPGATTAPAAASGIPTAPAS